MKTHIQRFFLAVLLFVIPGGVGVQTVSAESGKADVDFLARLKAAPTRVEDLEGKVLGAEQVKVERIWSGELCEASITNVGKEPVKLKNIILFDMAAHGLNPATPVYGEGFQKLAQSTGSLDQLSWRGPYPDVKHYKIPEPDGLPTVYGMMTIDLDRQGYVLLGFTSCKRFIGRFSFDGKQLRISVDPEGLELAPGETWKLEEFIAVAGSDRNLLLDQLAGRINHNHPPLPQPPLDKRTGWCTWYGVGGAGNQTVISEAAKFFSEKLPEVKFIQIDEGYTLEGNLLDVHAGFGDMKATAEAISACGLLPAIWVGPFVAAQKSHVLAEHPDWFVQGPDGKPLDSSKIGFGGWKGPWWCLDGSNPAASQYLEEVFRTMRAKYGFTYFKLDANYWGAIHSGKHFDPKATRVEAYRRGMEAVVRGAGPGAVILGCNAPMWPSFGLVNAMRTGNDVSRASFRSLSGPAKENLLRGWQNGKLWVSDPDCVLLNGDYEKKPGQKIPENVLYFHVTAIHACGGLVLSGDKIPDLGPEQMRILRKLVPPTGKSARFDSVNLETGVTDLGDVQYYYAFNWSDAPADRTLHLKQRSHLKNYWTDEDLGDHEGDYILKALPGQSAQLIVAQPAKP